MAERFTDSSLWSGIKRYPEKDILAQLWLGPQALGISVELEMMIHCIIRAALAFPMLGWRYVYRNRWGAKNLPGDGQDKEKRHNMSYSLRYDDFARPRNGR